MCAVIPVQALFAPVRIFLLAAVVFSGLAACVPGMATTMPHGTPVSNIKVEKAGRQPRLYATRADVERIRTHLDDPVYRIIWKQLRKVADKQVRIIAKGPVQDEDTLRGLVDRLPFLLTAYRITAKSGYLEAALQVMDRLASRQDWFGNEDRRAARAVFAAALAYDWLYNELDSEQRDRYRQTLANHAGILYSVLRNGSRAWARNYHNNHNHTNMMAIGVAAIVLYGEVDGATDWLKAAQENFINVLDNLSPDGGSSEGVGYWSGSTTDLLLYAMAAEPYFGIRLVSGSSYFRNTARFRLHASLPGFVENVDYSDSPRFDYHGPSQILHLLARINNDPAAQWTADRILEKRESIHGDFWIDLFWYDPQIRESPPRADDTYLLLDNLGLFFTRTSWADDATWAFFKAGPPLGWQAYRRDYYRGGHLQPDAGQFLLWRNGAWVVVDGGYLTDKLTSSHNVSEFGGIGQRGSGVGRFQSEETSSPDVYAKFEFTRLMPEYQYLVADLERMYPVESLLRNWRRTFVFLPEGILVIRDDYLVRGNQDFISRVHFEGRVERIGSNILCVGQQGDSRMIVLGAEGWSIDVIPYDERQKGNKSHARTTGLVAQVRGKIHNSASLVYVFADGHRNCSQADASAFSLSGNRLAVPAGDRTYTIDFAKREVSQDTN